MEKNGEKQMAAKKVAQLSQLEKGNQVYVKEGKSYRENPQEKINLAGQDLKLREMMIEKKHRRVYEKIKFGKKREAKEANKLEIKRKKIEQKSKS